MKDGTKSKLNAALKADQRLKDKDKALADKRTLDKERADKAEQAARACWPEARSLLAAAIRSVNKQVEESGISLREDRKPQPRFIGISQVPVILSRGHVNQRSC